MSIALIGKWVIKLLIAYLILVAVMFLLQRFLVFHPTPKILAPAEYGLNDFSEVKIKTEDGLTLTGWFHKSDKSNKAILFFYGNADSLVGYPPFFRTLADAGYTILGINYRGYGGSEGSPSELGFYKDGKAAFEYLHQYAEAKNIIVVGRSIGTGTATEIATKYNAGGLVLISPFTSLTNLASEIYWYLPVKYVSRYKFLSIDKLPLYKGDVLIIHGDADRLIPYAHAQRLFDVTNSRKLLQIYKGGSHIDLDHVRIAQDIIKFFGNQHAN